MLPFYDVLDYLQAIEPDFFKRFCHYPITNFYADLRIVFSHNFFKEPDLEKIARGGEYQNFFSIKKFFIHFFLSFKTAFERNRIFSLSFSENSDPDRRRQGRKIKSLNFFGTPLSSKDLSQKTYNRCRNRGRVSAAIPSAGNK
jgi:hypothetical protein